MDIPSFQKSCQVLARFWMSYASFVRIVSLLFIFEASDTHTIFFIVGGSVYFTIICEYNYMPCSSGIKCVKVILSISSKPGKDFNSSIVSMLEFFLFQIWTQIIIIINFLITDLF